MKLQELVGERIIITFLDGTRLEGIVRAADDEGIGFETPKKSTYVYFRDVIEAKTIPYLEEVSIQ